MAVTGNAVRGYGTMQMGRNFDKALAMRTGYAASRALCATIKYRDDGLSGFAVAMCPYSRSKWMTMPSASVTNRQQWCNFQMLGLV